MRTLLRHIVAISPTSLATLIIIGGWEPIYQLLRLFNVVGPVFNGFFISLGVVCAIFWFVYDYLKLLIHRARINKP